MYPKKSGIFSGTDKIPEKIGFFMFGYGFGHKLPVPEPKTRFFLVKLYEYIIKNAKLKFQFFLMCNILISTKNYILSYFSLKKNFPKYYANIFF